MDLKGSYDPSGLASIIQFLCNENKTGILRLTSDGKEVKVFIKDGVITFTMAPQEMADLLQQKGLLSKAALKKSMETSEDKDQNIVNMLVKSGVVTPAQLKKTIGKKAAEVIFNLFLGASGTFEYKDDNLNFKGKLITKLNTMSVLMEATLRVDEMSMLRKQIPDGNMVFKVADKFNESNEITFKPNEWKIFNLIDSRRTVNELIDESGCDLFLGYKILNALIDSGFIEQDLDALAEKQKMDNYTAILAILDETLKLVCDHLKRELERRTYTFIHQSSRQVLTRQLIENLHHTHLHNWLNHIINSCIEPLSSQQKFLVRHFDPFNPRAELIQDIIKFLNTYEDVQEGCRFLISCFNDFIFNIFEKLPALLGKNKIRELLKAAEKYVIELNPSRIDLIEPDETREKLISQIKQAKEKVADGDWVDDKSDVVFAIIF